MSTRSDDRYPIVEHFYTVQGEGTWSGRAAYFIRLAGCDVGCPWCDTKESWEVNGHPSLSAVDLSAYARQSGARIVVVTGGEPAMHNLESLTSAVRAQCLDVHLETSGAYRLSGTFDWVTLSPKKFKPPVDEVYPLADELKVVVAHESDFDWAETHRARCHEGVRLALQPEWDSPHMIKPIVEFVKQNPAWSISLQTHKYLNVR